MNLVQIGHRAVLVGKVANFFDWRDVPVHRVHRLEGDQLRPIRIDRSQLIAQIRDIVVLEQHLVRTAVTDAFDHRGVVFLVREDHAARHLAGKRRQRGPVGDIAVGEQQCRFLLVQIRKLPLQHHMIVVRSRDIARAAGTRSAAVDRLMHRGRNNGVLAHAEIVVRAPDRDLALTVAVMMPGLRESASLTLQISKDPIAPFLAKGGQLILKKAFVVHFKPPVSNSATARFTPRPARRFASEAGRR